MKNIPWPNEVMEDCKCLPQQSVHVTAQHQQSSAPVKGISTKGPRLKIGVAEGIPVLHFH